MRYLLDTHILLWYIEGNTKLTKVHQDIIMDDEAEVMVSYVSLWEMAIKSSLGKLVLPATHIGDVIDLLIEKGFPLLNMEKDDLVKLAALPYHHRDPFDRMLIAQCASRGLTLITIDFQIMSYHKEVSIV